MLSPEGAICGALSISFYTPRHSIPACLPKVCTHNTSYILKGNSLKRCMLVYCHMEIHIHCVIVTVWSERFQGVIALFDLK